MPLKLFAPRKGRSPHWTIRGTYLGVYVDRTSRTPDKRLALKAMKQCTLEIEGGTFSQPGEPTFAQAALDYMKAGGDRRFLKPLLEHFGETPVNRIDQAAIDAAAAKIYPSVSSATRNRQVYTPVCAVLRRSGVVLSLARPRGAGGGARTSWLWPEQCFRLFAEARKIDQTFAALLVTLTYTGLRLSEALQLTWNDVRLKEGFAYVGETKNGEPRAVFLPPMAVAELAHLDQTRPRCFRFSKSGHLYSLLRVAAIRAEVDLPERTAFHIFRHTYATWMRRFAKLDTRGLVATGAWRDRKSADRYQHVDVTEEAKKALLLPTPQWNARGN